MINKLSANYGNMLEHPEDKITKKQLSYNIQSRFSLAYKSLMI